MTERTTYVKRITIYLSIIFGVLFGLWAVECISPAATRSTLSGIISFIFRFLPVIAVLITKKLTSDQTKLNLSIKVWKNKKGLFLSILVPSLCILGGCILYYLILPNDLDYSAAYLSETYRTYGAPSNIHLDLAGIFTIWGIVYLISMIAVPVWFIALGEDIGWQGYLFPLLQKITSVKKAIILNGLLWGLAHAPLIYNGLNYKSNYSGAPFTGILVMTLACTILGIWMSYVTLKTNNIMYASIIHGSADVIEIAGISVSLSGYPLLGPGPSGLIGMSILFTGAIILLIKLKNVKAN